MIVAVQGARRLAHGRLATAVRDGFATGIRLRRLPIDRDVLAGRKQA